MWKNGGTVIDKVPEESTQVSIYAVGEDLLYLNQEMMKELLTQVEEEEAETTIGDADNIER